MKAAVLYRTGELTLDDVPMPPVGPRDVLVKVAAAGICHTDLGIVDGHVPAGKLPMILGHEVAGEIVQIGDEVSATLLGMRVCVSYGIVCGSCAQCTSGNDTLCDKWQTMGRTVNGGFAEYMAAPAENVVLLPHHVGFEEAAIIPCSVATAFHAVKRADIGPDQKVAILGIGGVGLNAVQFACLAGAEVIAVDVADRKLEIARSFGASACVNPQRVDVVSSIRELSAGRGADVCLEFVGSPATYRTCIDSVRRGGRVVVAGYHSEALQVNSLRLMLDEVTITGAHVANRSEIREIVGLLDKRRIDLGKMVTHTVAFEDILSGFRRLRTQEGDPIRIVVRF